MERVVNTSPTRIRDAGRNIAVHPAVVVIKVAAVVLVAEAAGASRAARAMTPIYPRVARATRRRGPADQPSQEAIRSATNIVATMDSARSTHTAAVNSAAADSVTGRVENREVTRVASRTAVVRAAAHEVAVAAVKADSRAARAPAAGAAMADPAAVVAVSRASVSTSRY